MAAAVNPVSCKLPNKKREEDLGKPGECRRPKGEVDAQRNPNARGGEGAKCDRAKQRGKSAVPNCRMKEVAEEVPAIHPPSCLAWMQPLEKQQKERTRKDDARHCEPRGNALLQ